MELDDWTLRAYMIEIKNQAEAARIAFDDLHSALSAKHSPRAFAAAQSLLAAGAMVSKTLWPMPSNVGYDGGPLDEEGEKRRTATRDRGRRLRRELGVKALPVLESRKVRNSLEHFDDRLDQHFANGPAHYVDRIVGPLATAVVIGDGPAFYLRAIDPEAGIISVMGEDVHVVELYRAIRDVERRASAWLSKVEEAQRPRPAE